MLVHKCDNCKKEIKGRDKEIIAGFAWPQFSFCGRCGKPIIAFLEKWNPGFKDLGSVIPGHSPG